MLLADAARRVGAQTPLDHLLAQVTTTRQPVRVIYRGLGWSRQALERLVATERVTLAGLGVQLHVAPKAAASGRREHYVTVDGVRYSALSRDG